MTFGVTLKKFQRKGLRALKHYRGVCLLADEMGLGKTIQALAWLTETPDSRPAVIVVPAHLKWHWEEEARAKFGLRTTVLNGMTSRRLSYLNDPILIINYEILGAWLKPLRKISPRTLIIDESHRIKNRSAKRTKRVQSLSREIPHRIAISGTPLVNRPAELWSTLNLLWPLEYPTFTHFAQRYCEPQRTPWGWQYKGATHLSELHYRLKQLGMVRRCKADVLADLPPKTRHVLPLSIPMKNYAAAQADFLAWLRDQGDEAGAKRAAKALQIVRLGRLKRLAAQEKLSSVFEWIDDWLAETNQKLAVYGIHKEIVRGIYNKYKTQAVCLDGSTPQRVRKSIVQKFQRNNQIRLFVGNIEAAGTGITLTAASTLAFVELDWVPGNHTQAEDRIHRIGQQNAAQIYYLIARNTIEKDLCRIIQEKQDVVSRTLDGESKRQSLDVFQQLTERLESKIDGHT